LRYRLPVDILPLMIINDHTDWLEIDLGAFKKNIKKMKEITGKPVMAVIKANGYGHGLVEIARAALQRGAASCGVARVEEAFRIRENGLQGQILVLGGAMVDHIPFAMAENIALTISDPVTARKFSEEAERLGGTIHVHAKVDTGMNRLGVSAEEGIEFLKLLKSLPGLQVDGLFTHFARADEIAAGTTEAQLARYTKFLTQVSHAGLTPPLVHAANSAASLFFPAARFDMVRPGIALFGINPAENAVLPEGFKPILEWKTRLISIKDIPAGSGISYGHKYTTSKTESVGVIAVGYADGFRRTDGNKVLIRGRYAPVIGTICMDQCMVNLDDIPDATLEDEVVLIGSQGGRQISAEMVARTWGTISYEVVCGLTARLPRIYRDE
jgi:alanine racemase